MLYQCAFRDWTDCVGKIYLYIVESLGGRTGSGWNMHVAVKFKSKYECIINGFMGETVCYVSY